MFQQTIIIGNLGRDPEMRFTPNGAPVTDFTVAVNRKWDGGEKVTWFKVTAWNKLAEICNQYLAKGRQVMVIGEVEAESWSAQDGSPRATLKLTARQVKFLGGRSGDSADETFSDNGYSDEPVVEDIPF